MGRIAFYAPLKSPDHPTPSGDREMARNLMAALRATDLGPVELMSHLRLLEKAGDPVAQARLAAEAEAEAARLIDHWQGRDLAAWVTYHNYYKAPDLVGPAVCDSLRLPYVQIESTRASKRLIGPWRRFAEAAHRAADRADAIFHLTDHDRETLLRDRAGDQAVLALRPFLARCDLPAPSRGGAAGPLLCVGMMRAGDKLASYRLIAETLALAGLDRPLHVAGDGPERLAVEALLQPFAAQTRYLGQLDRAAMDAAYGRASVLIWPGVNEAFGMTYLEAQAAGVPVVAQDRPGVCDVLAPGAHPTVDDGPSGLARRLTALRDPATCAAATGEARAHVAQNHLLPAAARTLADVLGPLMERGR